MSELRRNPLTGQWVIIAAERGGRPHERARPRSREAAPAFLESCPFCPGNEASTPPAFLEVADPATPGGWLVRGFPNRFAALGPDGRPADLSRGPLLKALPGIGAHDVIVESPSHNRFPADRTDDEMLTVLEAYRRRCMELAAQPSTAYVLAFKNHGEEAGTSLVHPHSQVIAAPLIPEDTRRSRQIARRHHARTGECLLCAVAEAEVNDGTRVVAQDERFVVFHPFASSRPAETWLVPLQHEPAFHQSNDDVLRAAAAALRRTLAQLRAGFGDPDFNYAIHSTADVGDDRASLHWYLQLLPRLTKAAGFELGSGIYINVAPPEETAATMRSASA